MAKIVTLKSPSAEDIYPVTDASGIRVTGNVTLQQALDGFVYADDPTAPANPNAWITGSDVDWTTTAQSYSTTEVDTGATWVDGRKIYKKTISCGGGSNQYKAVNHNISNLRRTIKIEGQAYDGNVCIPIPFVATGSGTSSSVQLYVSSTQIVIECGAARDNLTEMYITLWYTKAS